MVNTEMCRFCLDTMEDGKAAYPFDQQMCILEMGSGTRVTVGDALKYIELDVLIPLKKQKEETSEAEEEHVEEEEEEAEDEQPDHPELPKSLCQECLDKLQSIYEFKYRVLENRDYLKGYLNDLAEAKLAEERAARQAIAQELDIDLNNLDSLPDKLVLKQPTQKKERKPRKVRDPNEPPRKRRMPDKTVIIAEDSQIDTAVYVRKLVTTPEKASPDQKSSSKRKSKHVIIEDIAVAEKPKTPHPRYDRTNRKKEPLCDENNPNESNNSEIDTDTPAEQHSTNTKKAPPSLPPPPRDDEPIFEDDEEVEQKRTKRSRK